LEFCSRCSLRLGTSLRIRTIRYEDGVVTFPSTDKEYDPDCDCAICGKRKEYATWKAEQLSKKAK